MGGAIRRSGATAAVGALVVAILAVGAGVTTGLVRLPSGPTSLAQSCVGGSNLVPTLFGNDAITQIRLSSPDLKTQRVLRTEPANRLPAMFESLLSVSQDGSRLAYVTAADEQLDDAKVMFIDVAHPDQPHLVASEAAGLLPIRPVWSPTEEQLAFVVARTEQGRPTYHVLAGSATGGPVLSIASLSPDNFDSLQASVLCVSSAGAVSMLPPSASPAVGAANTAISQSIIAVTPTPTAGNAPTVGGIRCSLPVLSQNDPRWKDHRMMPTGESVGQVGCAVTSAAMVLDYYTANLTPDALSDCLGVKAVPIFWSRAAACTGGQVRGAVDSNFTWAGLDAILAAGRPAIVGMLGGLLGSHFVVVTSGGGDVADRYRIVDPWDGRTNATLGSYTRSNWTLHELVDFTATGPGCGALLDSRADPALNAVSGFSDGNLYHKPVTLHHLAPGVRVTVIKLSHDPHIPDQKWTLQGDLTASEDGNYQVIVESGSGRPPTVLSFTIDDHTPPTVGVRFLDQVSALKAPDGTTVPVVTVPGRFEITASDQLTNISQLQAELDNQPILYADGVAGTPNRTLVHAAASLGIHGLTYSATDAAGMSASGHVNFVVEGLPINSFGPPPPGHTAGGSPTTSGPVPSGAHNKSPSPGTGGPGGPPSPSPTVPGPPLGVLAIATDSGAGLSWRPPASNGGSAISGYVVTASPPGGTVSMSFSATAGVANVLKLTNGTTYTFTVAAVNSVGTGPPSSPSNAVTPYCSGFPLTSVTLSGFFFFMSTTQLTWQGNGSCGPFTGTLTATYQTSTGTSTATYQVSSATPSGSFSDSRAGTASYVSYKLVLKDAKGNSATATAAGP